jgi:hypothetical protein
LAEVSLKACPGAGRALAGALGGAEQNIGGRAHGGGAVAHASQQPLRKRPEGGDRGLDRRAVLLLAGDGGALFLGAALRGDVFVGGNPAPARQRLVLGEHDAAVSRLHVEGVALTGTNTVDDFSTIGLDVALEQPGVLAVLD